MINIVENALTGALNMSSLYMNNLYGEYKIKILKNRKADIESKRNQTASMGGSQGQFNLGKTLYLSPIYNNYVNIYGLPKYGAGFDPERLKAVEKLMRMIVEENPELHEILFPDELPLPVPPPAAAAAASDTASDEA